MPGLTAHADHTGSLLRPSALSGRARGLRRGQARRRRVQGRGGPGRHRGAAAAGAGRAARWSPTASCGASPSRASCGRGRRRRGRDDRRLAVGRLALRRASATAASTRPPTSRSSRRCAAAARSPPRSSPSCGPATDARSQDHAAEPDPVRQPLGPGRSRAAYPSFDDFMDDVVAILVDEVRELARLGCALRPARRAALPAADRPGLAGASTRSAAGRSSAGCPTGIELDNAVIDAAPRRDLRLPPVPRQPGLALAGRGRLRRHRRADLRRRPRPAAAARVRRRALGRASTRWRSSPTTSRSSSGSSRRRTRGPRPSDELEAPRARGAAA